MSWLLAHPLVLFFFALGILNAAAVLGVLLALVIVTLFERGDARMRASRARHYRTIDAYAQRRGRVLPFARSEWGRGR